MICADLLAGANLCDSQQTPGEFRPRTLKGSTSTLGKNKLRLKLAPAEYDALRRRVLERDGWRCQVCGSSKLQVHHLQRRSKLGDDEPDNLIVVCACCHRQQHGGC
jgi:DNA-directed RNA polymerase subunit M/transcription elongation factor TFIIS